MCLLQLLQYKASKRTTMLNKNVVLTLYYLTGEKSSHMTSNTFGFSIQVAWKYRSPGKRKTQTPPSDCQREKRDSSLQRTRLHCSRVQWRRALHHCIQRFALHLVMYGCSCSAMETHSMKLFTHCSWAKLKASWSLEVCRDWLCRKLATSAHYVPQHLLTCSVYLRGLPLSSWVAVVPSRFLSFVYYVFLQQQTASLIKQHRPNFYIPWVSTYKQHSF